ncbi:MAG: hemolysin III family protein [Myxococcota bacterium]|mgnify:CR=1 FL=1
MSIEVRFRILKDPVSAATHFAGFVAAVVGLVFLVVSSAHDPPKVTAMAIYGCTLVALFLASALYHFLDVGERGNRWLKRVDHVAIFLLIAGTYVPALLHLLDGPWRVAMLSAVGSLALAGVLLKIVWIGCPDWLSTALYLALGWIVVIPAHRMVQRLPPGSMAWLFAGGAAYTVGAIIDVVRRPHPWPPAFGHHEIFHMFVLVGAAAHYFFVVRLLEVAVPPF